MSVTNTDYSHLWEKEMILHNCRVNAVRPEPTLKDLAIASYILNTPAGYLKGFLNGCSIISKEDMQKLVAEKFVDKTIQKEAVLFKDGTFCIHSDSLNYVSISIAYYLNHSLSSDITELKEVLTNFSMSFALINDKADIAYREIGKLYEDTKRQFLFLNKRVFERECKRYKIKVEQFEDFLHLHFDNVSIGNEKEGYVNYNSIIIHLKEFKITAFTLRFDYFDFNSKWGFDFVLHPQLRPSVLPYGRNESLDYIPFDYSVFVEALNNMVRCPNYDAKHSLSNIKAITDTIIGMKKLWSNIRIRTNDKYELSKEIMQYYLK